MHALAQPWRAWPWPAPALATWLAAWLLMAGLRGAGVGGATALAAATVLSLGAGLWLTQASTWRRLIVALGFPLSAIGSGLAAGVPAWAWLMPLLLLLLAYPLKAWRDAPLFPTPHRALAGAARLAPLPPGARVLDAGCGLGHGLAALRDEWPAARLEGLEWSWPLRLAAALRCPWAQVRRGDIWAQPWHGLQMVYLFQRPESMARAWTKAQAEMAPGAWLISLDFAVPGVTPTAQLRPPGAQPVWLYRVAAAAQPPATVADNSHHEPAGFGRA